MEHDGHWACIDRQFKVMSFLDEIGKNGKTLREKSTGPSGGSGQRPGGEAVFAKTFPRQSPLRGLMLRVNGRDPRGVPFDNLAAAYPFAARGVPCRMRILGIEENPAGFQAWITAGIDDGPVLTFFDPLYFRNRARYRPGQEYIFHLAGLAYRLELEDHPAPARSGGTVSGCAPSASGKPGKKGSSIEFSTPGALLKGLAAIFPAGDVEDNYNFWGPVKEVSEFRFGGRRMIAVRVPVSRNIADEADLDLIVYVNDLNLRPLRLPQPGEDVRGTVWLQGFLDPDANGK